jgi:serpin B
MIKKLSAAAAIAILAAPASSHAQPINIGVAPGVSRAQPAPERQPAAVPQRPAKPKPQRAAKPQPAKKPASAVEARPAAKPQPVAQPQPAAAPQKPAAHAVASSANATMPFPDRLTAAQASLASKLVQELAGSKKAMIVVSPASVAGAAATLDLGASADLRTSLHTVLGFQNGSAAADLAALRLAIDGLKQPAQPALPLKLANAVVFDQAVSLAPSADETLKKAGVEHAVADLRAPASIDQINKRMREQTGGLITEILDRSPTGASLIVLNALHFKDQWKAPFNRADTKPAAFQRLSGAAATVSTMHLPQGKHMFRQDEKFVAIDMPYAHDRFSMVVVTTRGTGPAAPAAFASVGDWLGGRGFKLVSGELALPHFDVSASEDVTGPLDRLGLQKARLAPGALPGFTSDPARITRLVQRMELRVNEEGTEAAAATAVVAERGVDPDYVQMVVDKPFVFALRDKTTGLILMAGYVGEPTSLATAAR